MKCADPQTKSLRPVLMAGAITLLLLTGSALAIPREERGTQQDASTNDIASDTATETGALGEIFDPTMAEQQASDTWSRLHSTTVTSNAVSWPQETNAKFRVIGHYSERFNNMDVERLVTEAIDRDAAATQKPAGLLANPDLLERDLKPATNTDDEEKRMRALIRSVSAKSAEERENSIKGLRVALTYLVMAGLIILIIFARR